MTSRPRKPAVSQPLVSITVRLPEDEAVALAEAVYVVTSWKAVNAAQRAVKAVQVAARRVSHQETKR